jgi:hypothetical protein
LEIIDKTRNNEGNLSESAQKDAFILEAIVLENLYAGFTGSADDIKLEFTRKKSPEEYSQEIKKLPTKDRIEKLADEVKKPDLSEYSREKAAHNCLLQIEQFGSKQEKSLATKTLNFIDKNLIEHGGAPVYEDAFKIETAVLNNIYESSNGNFNEILSGLGRNRLIETSESQLRNMTASERIAFHAPSINYALSQTIYYAMNVSYEALQEFLKYGLPNEQAIAGAAIKLIDENKENINSSNKLAQRDAVNLEIAVLNQLSKNSDVRFEDILKDIGPNSLIQKSETELKNMTAKDRGTEILEKLKYSSTHYNLAIEAYEGLKQFKKYGSAKEQSIAESAMKIIDDNQELINDRDKFALKDAIKLETAVIEKLRDGFKGEFSEVLNDVGRIYIIKPNTNELENYSSYERISYYADMMNNAGYQKEAIDIGVQCLKEFEEFGTDKEKTLARVTREVIEQNINTNESDPNLKLEAIVLGKLKEGLNEDINEILGDIGSQNLIISSDSNEKNYIGGKFLTSFPYKSSYSDRININKLLIDKFLSGNPTKYLAKYTIKKMENTERDLEKITARNDFLKYLKSQGNQNEKSLTKIFKNYSEYNEVSTELLKAEELIFNEISNGVTGLYSDICLRLGEFVLTNINDPYTKCDFANKLLFEFKDSEENISGRGRYNFKAQFAYNTRNLGINSNNYDLQSAVYKKVFSSLKDGKQEPSHYSKFLTNFIKDEIFNDPSLKQKLSPSEKKFISLDVVRGTSNSNNYYERAFSNLVSKGIQYDFYPSSETDEKEYQIAKEKFYNTAFDMIAEGLNENKTYGIETNLAKFGKNICKAFEGLDPKWLQIATVQIAMILCNRNPELANRYNNSISDAEFFEKVINPYPTLGDVSQ